MKYLSTFEAARKWGITPRRVLYLIKSGRIPEAKFISSRWMIPESAEKPVDGRTKDGKKEHEDTADFFRYPIFECKDASTFNPPLSDEELIFKKAAEAFYACDFEGCDEILGRLPETTKNRYVRIYALRAGCQCDIFLGNTNRFFERYGRLATELQSDFPHKKEMQECIHEIDASLGDTKYFTNEFKISPNYHYHESFLPHLTSLSAVSYAFASDNISPREIKAQEINCIYLEREGALVDLQCMHIYLGCAYAFLNMPDEMTYHFGKSLMIAEKYNLFYAPALHYYYMRKPMSLALQDFSEDFKKRLIECSDDIHNRFISFTDKTSSNTIYRLLPHGDYMYLYLAVYGYTNKEVAMIIRVSEGTVGKRYGEIYATLGVKSKQEMIAMYKNA